MKTDRVFVLLLVVLLPLSGCFDGSVGDADATEDSSENTTVINNYYNNTTLMEEKHLHHAFANGTIIINSSIGEIIEIVDVDAVRGIDPFSVMNNYHWINYEEVWIPITPQFEMDCLSFSGTNTVSVADHSDFLPSDGGACSYTIENNWNYSYWSGVPSDIQWPIEGFISISYYVHQTN